MPYARKDLLIWQVGMYYHIYNRGASRSTLFREPTNFLYVIEKLQKYRLENSVRVIAYCLMPNHYHLLPHQGGEQPVGNVPQSVFNTYAKAYNRKCSQGATLFDVDFPWNHLSFSKNTTIDGQILEHTKPGIFESWQVTPLQGGPQ